ncbi:MAG TPA: MmcQ/YjbR family DNA-binding protein [Polyangiales bacterium]|nr:MmcQ/YjbR family DNA-binding protein [Polyangiales bacterium]
MPGKKRIQDAAVAALRKFGLAYPQAHTKSPWPGHLDLAVKDKTFAYLSAPGEPFSISCKLPYSNVAALSLPFAEPTAYGLGKSGWVSANFQDGEQPPLEMFKSWIDESYRAIAPKKLIAELDGAAKPAAKAPERKSPSKAKPAKRKKAVTRR